MVIRILTKWPALSKSKQLLVDLLTIVPPLHHSDCDFIADLFSLSSKHIEELRKEGYILAIGGYRTASTKNTINTSSRLKAAVIAEALCGLVEWEDAHNFGEGELDPDGVVDILSNSLESSYIPYTEKYRQRQKEIIVEHLPKGMSYADIEEAGIYLDFWDSRNKTLHLHLLDDTKNVSKAKLRTYLIKILGEAFRADVKTEIFTTDQLGARQRYFKIDGAHISVLDYASNPSAYFAFVNGLRAFC